MLAAYLMEDYGISVNNFGTAVVVAVVISLFNAFLKPLLIILTLPITVLTLGLFLLVINAIIIYFAGSLIGGFVVSSFWSAFFFSLVYSICMSFLEFVLGIKD